MGFLGKTLLAFALLHILYSKVKFACYSRYFLTSYFCIPVPNNEEDNLWGVLVLEGLVGLHVCKMLNAKTLPATLQMWFYLLYPHCLEETSVCSHSDSISFVKLWQP